MSNLQDFDAARLRLGYEASIPYHDLKGIAHVQEHLLTRAHCSIDCRPLS